jgi:hypothetical protein
MRIEPLAPDVAAPDPEIAQDLVSADETIRGLSSAVRPWAG